LEKILGSSRSGSILRASRIDTGRAVVIKLINVPAPADPSVAAATAARFGAYAAALARLRHPNLAAVLDWGLTPDGGAFLVMERLDGEGFEAGAPALAAAAGNGAAPERVLPLLAQAVAGLEELARHGLAHLNLCPENLFLVPGGVASAAGAATSENPATPATSANTGAGAPQVVVKLLGLGTPLFHLGEPWPEAPCARFRAPELASPAAGRQEGLPGWQADCYSLALTACYALGATVASGEVAGTTMQTVQMPLALRFELANDEALRQVLERCLRRSPPDRPAHAAIREALTLALGGAEPSGGAAAAAPDLFGDGGKPGLPAPAGPLDDEPSLFSAALPLPGQEGGPDPGDPRDWRSLLGESLPLPEPPRWRSPSGLAVDDEPGATAGRAAAAAPAGSHAAGGGGGDSSLDLFDVPAVLPSLPEEQEPADRAGAAFGLHLPDGFELPPAYDEPAAGPHEAGGVAAGSPAVAPPLPADAPAAKPAAPIAAAIPGAAVAAPAGAPGPSSGAAPPGEMLSAVDELLGSLPPPPPVTVVPTAAARPAPHVGRSGGGRGGAGGTATAMSGRPAGAAPAAAPGRSSAILAGGRRLVAPLLALPRPVLLSGAGALLLVAAVGAWLAIGRGARHAPLAPAAAGVAEPPAGPPPRPGRSAAAKFSDASSYLIFGKESDGRVRAALRELTFADQAELGPARCRQLAAIQQMLAASALTTVQQDLAGALRNGDLGALEDVVEVASDRDLPPSQHGDLARARNLSGLYQRAQAAAGARNHAEVLERFRAMQGLSKTLRDPLELRDQAARALEADALALARDGKYDEAVARLGPILSFWPERAGIKDLVKSYQAAAASEAQQLAILEGVPAFESRRKPSVPLDQLRALQPTPHLEQRIAETKQRLEAQLAQLDAQPPEVTLRPGYPLDYARGTMIILSFRVTDDYEVKSVKLFARPEAGKMRELTLQKSSFGWDVEIPPSFHQNGTVELYVVATDVSGHEGFLGSPEKPLLVKRRQGFQQLLH
ncbi:MAG: hypothetical protein JOZ15_18315, partial [Acidobacteria bacterium]|nr:hypothetical protein [Acidobacteriota bacterium]